MSNVTLITGAAGGIGQAIAHRLARETGGGPRDSPSSAALSRAFSCSPTSCAHPAPRWYRWLPTWPLRRVRARRSPGP